VPVIRGNEEYKVLLIVNGHVLDSQTASAKSTTDGQIKVQFNPVIVEPANYTGQIAPVPPAYQ
jgi:hypothetical protein